MQLFCLLLFGGIPTYYRPVKGKIEITMVITKFTSVVNILCKIEKTVIIIILLYSQMSEQLVRL